MKVWIDTDGGIDDALALACAFAAPRLELAGISTVFGNVAPRKAARNAALVQSFFEPPHVGISVGATAPLTGHWRDARIIHGEDGLGGASSGHVLGYEIGHVHEDGPEICARHIAGFARRTGADGALVCLGPLTNLAIALRREPDAFAGLGQIVCMGGALSIPRSRRGTVEFNFGSDLEAVRGVLAAAPRLTVIPLDTCRQVVLRRARLAVIAERSGSPLTHFLQRAHNHYMDHYRASDGIDGCYPHDTLAIAAVAAPGMFRFQTLALELSDDASFPGLLRESGQGRSVQIATRVDQRAALDWIEACICAPAPH
ncbi:nucleoside hydrolase [Maricaulis salignorans]|uniref:nucleoside hydrolase n=1 Tax=Maricaulis salignorans TaxID=144026 RepID=UPI003A93508F